ncbi:MAG: hypothetical protein GY869_25745 [Planctomycetes bacterium]|nr:hypothetical protein [Planctomycetota bacterium]
MQNVSITDNILIDSAYRGIALYNNPNGTGPPPGEIFYSSVAITGNKFVDIRYSPYYDIHVDSGQQVTISNNSSTQEVGIGAITWINATIPPN